jgi:hypothetical protein
MRQKNKYKVLKQPVYLLLLMLMLACSHEIKTKQNPLHDFFAKMPGKWMLENGSTVEKWEKDGNLYKSTVYKVLRKDSIVSERIRIREIDGKIYYEATVRGQNQEKPTLFKLIETSSEKVVFENKNHDFPQKIVYQYTGEDKLTATILGMMNGKPQKIEFKYAKIKQ